MNSPGQDELSRLLARRAHICADTANLAEFHTPLSPSAAALGFRGWHSRGHLPHFDQPDTVQAITFRLADSLPAPVVARLAAMADSPAERKLRGDWLDRAHAACWLRRRSLPDSSGTRCSISTASVTACARGA